MNIPVIISICLRRKRRVIWARSRKWRKNRQYWQIRNSGRARHWKSRTGQCRISERLTAEKKLKETERNALLDPELEAADRKLEKLKAEHQEAVDGEQRWEKKIEDGRERIREEEIVLKKLEEQLELRRDTLKEKREDLEEQQEILQWEHHEKVKEKIGLEEYEERETRLRSICKYGKNHLTTGRTALSEYELISGQYEEAASRLEETKKKKQRKSNGWRWQKNRWPTESMHGSRKSFTERKHLRNGIRNVRFSCRRSRKQDDTIP